MIDLESLGTSMIAAAREAVPDRWPSLKVLAEMELRKLAFSLSETARLLREGDIDAQHAQRLVHIHQLSVRSVLVTVEGLGIRTAEETTHAAVRAVSSLINDVVGFKLL